MRWRRQLAKFIPVHTSRTAKPDWVNIEHIWRIVNVEPNSYSPDRHSFIYKSDHSDDYFGVIETTEEIMALIDKAALLAATISGDT